MNQEVMYRTSAQSVFSGNLEKLCEEPGKDPIEVKVSLVWEKGGAGSWIGS